MTKTQLTIFINTTLGIDAVGCSVPSTQCTTTTIQGTLKLNYLLSLLNSPIVPASACASLSPTGGFCTDKYLFYSTNTTVPADDSAHSALNLYSYCQLDQCMCMPSVAGASKLQEVPGILCEGEGAGDEG